MSAHRGDDPEKHAARMERAARVRAARAYADIDQAHVAERLDVSVMTVKRIERGQREITIDELHLLADLTGFPRDWMEHGFAGTTSLDAEEMVERMRFVVAHEVGHAILRLSEALLAGQEAQEVSRAALRRLQSPAENAG